MLGVGGRPVHAAGRDRGEQAGEPRVKAVEFDEERRQHRGAGARGDADPARGRGRDCRPDDDGAGHGGRGSPAESTPPRERAAERQQSESSDKANGRAIGGGQPDERRQRRNPAASDLEAVPCVAQRECDETHDRPGTQRGPEGVVSKKCAHGP